MNPQEPAATARRPLRIGVLAKEGGRAIGTLDSEVVVPICFLRERHTMRGASAWDHT